MKNLLLQSLILLVSCISFANPCEELTNTLAGADKADEKLVQLKDNCEVHLNQKKNIYETEIKAFIKTFSRAELNSAYNCMLKNYLHQNSILKNIAQTLKKMPVDLNTDIASIAKPYMAKLDEIEAQQENLAELGLRYCYSNFLKDFIIDLKAKKRKFQNEQIGFTALSKIENSIVNFESSMNTKLSRQNNLVNANIKAIRQILTKKTDQQKQKFGTELKTGVASAVHDANQGLYSLQLYLSFLSQINFEYRFRESQNKFAWGMTDIALDELIQLLRELKVFESQFAGKMIATGELALRNEIERLENTKILFTAKTLTEKDSRLMMMLKLSEKRLGNTRQICGDKYSSFNARFEKFEKLTKQVITAYSQDIEVDLAIARHRFSESILQEGYYLILLCGNEGNK